MDPRTRALFLSPAPLADPSRPVDALASVATAADGLLDVRTVSGRVLTGRLSCPAAGVLRVQLATSAEALAEADRRDSALLVVPAAPALPVTQTADGVEVLVGDLAVAFGPGGLSGGALTAPGPGTRWGVQPDGWLVPFGLGADDAVYGGGECFAGPDLRGGVRTCVNVETHGAVEPDRSYLTVPFVWSDAGWGAWAHTGAPVRLDVAATHPSLVALEVPGPVLDVFVYLGDPLRQHQAVTGLPGALPDWALGVWTSRCSYLSAAEVSRVLDSYDAADCPVDVVHVDAWPTGNVVKDLTTSWEVDRSRWPAGWAKELTDRGVRLSLWHNSYLRADTAAGADAVAQGLVLRDEAGALLATNDMPDRLVLDFTSTEAREWWRSHVTDLLRSEGAVSVKPDFAEEVPPDAVTADGRTGWDIRNEYAVLYQRASHEAVADVTGEPVALFCRSGTAGAQRYPTHWVGDTPSTWEGMAAALRACLSLSLSGFGLVATDVGGFWADGAFERSERAFADNDPSAFTADVDPELFLRWTQLGVLSPVLRFHGTGVREPWAYPSPYGELAVEAVRLRKRLQPYLVSTAEAAAAEGTPVMRPMVLAFPGDRAARDAHLQYLLGPSILVAPVLSPGGRVRVFAPAGTWEGLAGAPALDGPGWHDVSLDLSAVPAWVRPGTNPLETQ
jgi:alpha-D-xyloside xylohydrolase